MNKKRFFKNEKGSITLYVLLACLFFVISLVSVNTYMKNKEISVESEYQKIKQSYEQDVGNEAEIYQEVKNK